MPKSNTKYTSQHIDNESFDEVTNTSVVLPVEYDPSGATKRTVTGNLATKVTVSGSDTYIGEATIGTAESSPLWRCQKISTSGGTTSITWADGNDEFDNDATDLTALSYS